MNPKSLLLILVLASSVLAQQMTSSPRLIRFNGQLPVTQPDQTIAISFAIYEQAEGGAPLWSEIQNVSLKDGKFAVVLGSTRPEGLPVGIFASAEANWLQWQISGQEPGPRTQIVSVPYALSAANAETLAGHPLSDFVLAASIQSNIGLNMPRAQRGARASSGNNSVTGSNSAFSQLFEDGGFVGIGTVAPSAKLEVAGDVKISGPDSALIFADGTRLTANSAAGVTAKNIEQVRFADQFAAGSSTGGIAEAYADCPSTGCKVELGQDVNIATPQIITVHIGKPLFLDLAGRTIKVTNSTGVGLTFTSENINARTPMTIQNGTLSCSFRQSNLSGFAWTSSVNVSLQNLDVRDCNTPGSTAVLWDFVEDSNIHAVGFRNNRTALRIQNASNQVSFRDVWFDGNANALISQDNSGVTLEDCLVQSNSGARTIQFLTSAGSNATTIRINKCHFENNGDSTAASRNIYIAPAAIQYILGVSIEDNVFTSGAYGATGTSLEVAGSRNVLPIVFKNNQYNGYRSGKIVTGLGNDSRVTSIGENLGIGAYGYDVGINTHGLSGLSFAPEAAKRAYQLFAGWPGNYDGFLQFWDTTSNTSILNYSSGSNSWTFPKTAVFNAAVVLSNSQSINGYSDDQHTQTWSVSGATGAARFDGGASVGASGLSINNGTALTTTAQTGTGSIVMSNSPTLTNPNLGDAEASSLSLNGEAMSAAPRMVYSVAVVNPSSAGLQSRWTLDKAIVVTRFQFVINNGNNASCLTASVLQLTDGTTQVSLPLANNQTIFDSGVISLPFAAGSDLDLKIVSGSAGCATSAGSGNANVQYRMQ